MAEALLNDSFGNRVFWRGTSLWTPISGRWGRRPQSIYGPLIGEWCSYNFAAGSFYTKKLCSRLFSREVEFNWHKQRYRVFVPPFGDLGVTYTVNNSSMARWKARGRLPIRLSASYRGWGAMSRYWSKLRCLKGGGSLWTQISRGKGRYPTKDFWHQKTRVPGLSYGEKNRKS